MSKKPPPRVLTDESLSDLIAGNHFGTLATNKSTGFPHLTTMLYQWDPVARVLRFTTRADRVKVKHLRRDPRAALHVPGSDVWSFAVAEGEVDVSEVTTVPGDAVGQELLDLLPADFRPENDQEFFADQVAEQRVVLRLKVNRLYGAVLDQ